MFGKQISHKIHLKFFDRIFKAVNSKSFSLAEKKRFGHLASKSAHNMISKAK